KLLAEQHAVDQRAVTAGEIAQEDPVRGDTQEAVLPADPFVVGPDLAFLAAAEIVFAGRELHGLAGRLPPDHDEFDFHFRSHASIHCQAAHYRFAGTVRGRWAHPRTIRVIIHCGSPAALWQQ